MPKSPSPQLSNGVQSPPSPQILTVFSNSILDDFHQNETFRAGSSSDGNSAVGDREELCKNTKSPQNWAEYKAKMKRNKRIWIFALLAICAFLVLFLVGLGIRHSSQQKQMEGQKKLIQARKEEIEHQKNLIKFHREKLEKAKNVSEIHREHLELQKDLLNVHERSNQTLMETLNQTTNLLEKCVDERDKLQGEMWNMQSEMERMKKMETSMEAAFNLSESNFETQRKVLSTLKDQLGQKDIEMKGLDGRIEELKKDIEGKQDELETLRETVKGLNGSVADLTVQNQFNQQIIASKKEVINNYEEEVKILRIANESKASHEERANTMEKQLEMMRKQLETSQHLVDSEQRHSQTLRTAHENEVLHYQKQLKEEKERRDEIAVELRAIKDGHCYRVNCRSN